NSNPNAPLKVEWRLDVKLVEGKDQQEIRTTLYELYSGSLVLARNFTFSTDNNLNYNWEEVAAFYADYMTKIRSFYILRVAK
ncbi:MAG: hypothetical protein KDK38_09685, partial [Leptospiraceae bacterium]|nr:hypothetical protein [Leptospiraceae bacterium]